MDALAAWYHQCTPSTACPEAFVSILRDGVLLTPNSYYLRSQHEARRSSMPRIHDHGYGRSIWRDMYPAEMHWDRRFLSSIEDEQLRNRMKKRMVGRFIGLRGCETPAEERKLREEFEEALERARRRNRGLGGNLWKEGFGGWGWGYW